MRLRWGERSICAVAAHLAAGADAASFDRRCHDYAEIVHRKGIMMIAVIVNVIVKS